MQDEVEGTVAAWSRYKAFRDERDQLADCPWDTMRNQLHQVDDFVSKWSKECEKVEDPSMKLTLLREVDAYRKCVPLTTKRFDQKQATVDP